MVGRELSGVERRLLSELLAHDFSGVVALREQAVAVRARAGCTCGCGTIDLIVDERVTVLSEAESPVPVSGEVSGIDGTAGGGLILLLEDGRLGALEIYSYEDEPLPMPEPAQVTWVLAADADGAELTADG